MISAKFLSFCSPADHFLRNHCFAQLLATFLRSLAGMDFKNSHDFLMIFNIFNHFC